MWKGWKEKRERQRRIQDSSEALEGSAEILVDNLAAFEWMKDAPYEEVRQMAGAARDYTRATKLDLEASGELDISPPDAWARIQTYSRVSEQVSGRNRGRRGRERTLE